MSVEDCEAFFLLAAARGLRASVGRGVACGDAVAERVFSGRKFVLFVSQMVHLM